MLKIGRSRRAITWTLLALTNSVFAATYAQALEPEDNRAGDNTHAVCSFVANHAGDGDVLRLRLKDAGEIDINNDDVSELVEHRPTGTSGASTHIVTFESGESLSRFDFRDAEMEDWLRWANRTAWLPYEGEVFRVYFEDEIGPFVWAVARIAPDNLQDVICRFETVIVEQLEAQTSRPADSEICRWFAASSSAGLIEFEATPQLTVDELGRSSPGSRHRPVGLSDFDFDNDGQAEPVMAISVSSGAGRGCDLVYFDLTNSDGSEIVHSTKRDLLMALQDVDLEDSYPHRRCGGISRFVRRLGVTYFEARHRDRAPYHGRGLHHWVRSTDGARAIPICEANFSVQTSLR